MQVAIIGAGINGLYLAWKLSLKGYKVTIFERKGEIGNRACSGLFSERILQYIPESRGLIKNKIDHALINFPEKTVKINFSEQFLVMSHFELDNLVADLAQKNGARIILNSNITKIPISFDKIIGCDGPMSSTRKLLNLPDPKYRLGILGLVREQPSNHYVETWPVKCEARLGRGFIWKIPRGENIEYGIIADPSRAKALFDAFLQKNNIILSNIEAKLVPQGFIIPNNGDITLCGDATGLTKPWSGGGVLWQLELADILIKNFPDFKNYRKEAKRKFFSRLFFSNLATSLVYFLGFRIPWLLPNNSKIESDCLFVSK